MVFGMRGEQFEPGRNANGQSLAKFALLLCLLLVWPYRALAGGLFLSEIGTPALGLASAGSAARAQDASTLFTNPAGMTRLEGSQILMGAQPIYGHEVFSPN